MNKGRQKLSIYLYILNEIIPKPNDFKSLPTTRKVFPSIYHTVNAAFTANANIPIQYTP
jgi:hypothetical protein